MNSLAGSSEFSDLKAGDEVEFQLTFSQKAQKNSAIHICYNFILWPGYGIFNSDCLSMEHLVVIPWTVGYI